MIELSPKNDLSNLSNKRNFDVTANFLEAQESAHLYHLCSKESIYYGHIPIGISIAEVISQNLHKPSKTEFYKQYFAPIEIVVKEVPENDFIQTFSVFCSGFMHSNWSFRAIHYQKR